MTTYLARTKAEAIALLRSVPLVAPGEALHIDVQLRKQAADYSIACNEAGDWGAAKAWRNVARDCHEYDPEYVAMYLRCLVKLRESGRILTPEEGGAW